MGSLISKFNLYEFFRILLPGAYITFIIFETFKNQFHSFQLYWPEISLLTFLSSLIFGVILYSLDLCRFFKKYIKNLPTNLMERYYPWIYPGNKPNMNEHRYYSWYENSKKNSKIKTELQSGLYHLSVNMAAVGIVGLVIGIIIFVKTTDFVLLILNLTLICFSALSAICIVRWRLSRQWLRNFWEFLEDIILPKIKKGNPILIVLVGLPGAGKSTYINFIKDAYNGIAVEGFHANAIDDSPDVEKSKYFKDLISSLKQNKNCIIADIEFCNRNRRDEVKKVIEESLSGVKIEYVYLENNPQKCSQNVKSRNRKMLKEELEKVKRLSQNYIIPPNSNVIRVY